jgi:hypothetical protein
VWWLRCLSAAWVWRWLANQVGVLLEGILKAVPDPTKLNEDDEQIAVMRMMALEYGGKGKRKA